MMARSWFVRLLNYWPEFVVFAAAVAGSLASYFLLKSSENANADTIVLQQAADDSTNFIWEIQRSLGDLQTITAFMSISRDWQEDYFRESYHALCAGILSRSPGTQGLHFAPTVTTLELRNFVEEQQARQLGLGGDPQEMRNSSGRRIRCIYYKNAAGVDICSGPTPLGGPLGLGGAAEGHAWFPAYFVEPLNDTSDLRASNLPVVMFDLGSEPVRNQTLSAAILGRAPSATPRVILNQASLANQFGVIVVSPVYQCNATAPPGPVPKDPRNPAPVVAVTTRTSPAT